MKRRLVWIIAAITAVVSAIVVRNVYKADRKKKRDSASQLALLRYSQSFKPGLTRKDLEDGLRAGHTIFFERCCYDERSAFADVVQVGEEDAPWYCSEWPVYVVFEFSATTPRSRL
jgi:hypothetical protein